MPLKFFCSRFCLILIVYVLVVKERNLPAGEVFHSVLLDLVC
jgi:hypothetical protein